MHTFKKWVQAWERLLMAVTFAEAGERETALDIIERAPAKKQSNRIRSKISKREDIRPELRM